MRKISLFQRNLVELTGVVHNHSDYSYDCEIPVKSVIHAAYKNELDYITINDHNIIASLEDVNSALSYFDQVKRYSPMVIVGSELNDSNGQHHLLVFEGKIPKKKQTIEATINEQRQNNAFLFAAHPYEERISKKYPLYIWDKTELLHQVNGMEIWNYASSWLSSLNPKVNGLLLLLLPNLFVRKAFPENLKVWDQVNMKGHKLAAIGSTDAHGTKLKVLFIPIRILTHKKLFKTIRTNVLIDEGKPINEKSIIQALSNGNSYVANYLLGYPYNFFAGICKVGGEGVTLGEEIAFESSLKYYFRLPKEANVKLIKNGKVVSRLNERLGNFTIQSPGNYRLEISRFGLSWIYTNNIYVNP